MTEPCSTHAVLQLEPAERLPDPTHTQRRRGGKHTERKIKEQCREDRCALGVHGSITRVHLPCVHDAYSDKDQM
ncbi:Hypothetical predicted protein [Podarcis lilfordi]|uniref:Uncharacterized protein n=1 Tax=Podarcis lilfordi TaxID=74358 RepID=A0AA35PL70_9SAUR|nr:Hypothetical predicted protein [Podarcis lilfordi]